LSASEQNVETARLWWARFNETGEPPLELCHDDVEMRNPDGFLVRGPYHGHDGIRRWRQDVFDVFDDPHVEVEEVVPADDGETVVMVLRLQGTARHTGIEVDEPWAAVCRIRDGKFVYGHGYAGRGAALEAAGLGK
jgi:ketosteroid isomerase-like protein